MTRVLEKMQDVQHHKSNIEDCIARQASILQLPELDLASLWNILDLDLIRVPDRSTTKEQRSDRYSPLTFEASAALIRQLCKSSLYDGAGPMFGRVPPPSVLELKTVFDTLSGPRMLRLDPINAKLNALAIEALLQVSFKVGSTVRSSSPQSHGTPQPSLAHAFAIHCFDELERSTGTQRYGALAGMTRTIFLVGSTPLGETELGNRTLSPMQEQIIALVVRETTGNSLIELREFSLLLLCDLLEMDLCTPLMLEAFEQCLSDYTMDQQKGDVGSHLRIAAVHAVDLMLKRRLVDNFKQIIGIIAKVCGLAVEKLDRVRHQAYACLNDNWDACGLVSVTRPYVDANSPSLDVWLTTAKICLEGLGYCYGHLL